MTAAAQLVFVGELNPYGIDPKFALYHQPRGASGDRLRAHLGLRDATYARITKINLCVGAWSVHDARARAQALLESMAGANAVLVLLGAKVRRAFGGPPSFTLWEGSMDRPTLIGLPHPSGRSVTWNQEGARDIARALLRMAVPGVPWGEVDA